MLDDKIKDVDARFELLEHRQKKSKWFFLFFYVIGFLIVLISACFVSSRWDEVGIGVGLALMIVSVYFLVIYLNYDILIILKRDKEEKK